MHCSSINCHQPQEYCNRCSHANFTGSAKIGDKKYRWTHNPRFGPIFYGPSLSQNRQPGTRHKVWVAFEQWIEGMKNVTTTP